MHESHGATQTLSTDVCGRGGGLRGLLLSSTISLLLFVSVPSGDVDRAENTSRNTNGMSHRYAQKPVLTISI